MSSLRKHLTDEDANDARLFANDAIDQLRRHRKRHQLIMLKIQLDRAIADLDTVDEKRAILSAHSRHRSKNELVWCERAGDKIPTTREPTRL